MLKWLNDHEVVRTVGVILALVSFVMQYIEVSGWSWQQLSALVPLVLAEYARLQVSSKATTGS